MSVSEMFERNGRAGRAPRPRFDLIVSKLRRPPPRPGIVDRRVLLRRLARDDDRPVVSVVAPPGYGKSTVLSQWAERSRRAFAWVTVEEPDNDPKVLLAYVAAALDEIEPIDERVFDALASSGSSVPGSVVPRLGSAFAAMSSPVVLVLDDVHVLRDRECRSALSVLADHVPAGSQLVLAGRADPPLRVARLRAEGRILEIGPSDLSLTAGEAAALLDHAGVILSADEAAELHGRTEGWAAGLHIAALAIKAGSRDGETAPPFSGDDIFMRDYLRSEVLDRLPEADALFLTRTAALERMSGPLCDAVLGRQGSAATLAGLAQSNLLVVPLDRRGQWYRYHHLFRDLLLAELDRLEPGLVPALRQRAAQWHEGNGRPDEALEYWMQAGDADSVARLVTKLTFPAYQCGMVATVERRFRWLQDHADVDDYPAVAVLAGLICALSGKPGDAERWARAAERGAAVTSLPDGSPSMQPWLALLRALLCRDGAAQMRADAELAAATMAGGSFWRTAAILYLGMAHLMAGDPDKADVLFADAIAEGQAAGVTVGPCVALAERSLLASAGGEWHSAERYLGQARTLARDANLDDHPPVTIVYAAAARIALHQGDRQRAREELAVAQRLRPALTHAVPHLAVQARLELAGCYLALADPAGARTLLREIEQILLQRPDLGVLAGQTEELRARLTKMRGPSGPGASALTTAELRLLPLLCTHLSFPEIGEELFLSPNTVKSQAISIYRKLGVSSRSQAVTQSRELGLLEA
jgi:LuxR family transcriptional regulator, maltose regulon positive regulatory protein